MVTPSVSGNELKSVTFYKSRERTWRLDTAPFYVIYPAVVIATLSSTMSNKGFMPWSWWKVLFGSVLAGHALVRLLSHWSVGVRSIVAFKACPKWSQATHCKVLPGTFAGKKDIVEVQRRAVGEGAGAEEEISFEFHRQRFCYDQTSNMFEKLKYPTRETFSHYRKSTGYGTESKVLAALMRWGPNKFVVPIPQFSSLLGEQLLAPFFCFQVFCVGLWALDEYWYYSLFTLGMLVMFESTVVTQRLRNLKELRSLQTPKQPIMVYRQGKWEQLPGDALLPGDVISIGRPAGGTNAGDVEKLVPADALLLAGTCIVDEAVLTGESTPQWKAPVGTPDGDQLTAQAEGLEHRLSIKRDKNHVLFSGTKLLQHTGDKDAHIKTPDGACLAIVLRTGFETSQGRLMRTILYSTEHVSANNWETGLFILFLMVFAIAASAYVLYHGLQDPDRNRFKLFLNCTMIVTSVIPPELPMELTIAVNSSLLALSKKLVFCTEPFRIPLAGKVDICCFDKTGTLTSDNMVLEGLTGLPGRGEELVRDMKQAGAEVVRVLASCQALIQVEGKFVGDPLEKASFTAVGWQHSEKSVTSPKLTGKPKEVVTILHRLHFTSALKRMATLVRVEHEGGSGSTLWALLKGAPEVVQPFLRDAPADYEQSYKRYASQGARVIALAYKQLGSSTTASDLRTMPRAEIEKDLSFGGFAVLRCPLKAESEPALKMLKESSHQLVMITGDAPLTACYTAAQVHIVDRPVLLLVHRGAAVPAHKHPDQAEPDSHFEWITPDESSQLEFTRDRAAVLQMASEWDLCISGDGLTHLQQTGQEAAFIPLAQVFARVSPDQKELVLRTLRAAGWTTLMCGDGTNDVGALKAAHVGVALLPPSEAQIKAQKEREEQFKQRQKDIANRKAALRRGVRPPPISSGPATPVPTPGQLVAPGPSDKGAVSATGPGQKSKKKGAGTKMLDDLKKKGKPVTPKLEEMALWLDSLDTTTLDDGQVAMVKPGDASMASPFTAKQGHIMPCTDILKQGRSTLVTTVQMFKILGLLCLSTAYSLSVMYLQGVKLGDMQATVQGFLSTGLFFVISNSTPLPTLSAERPHPTIFSLYVFLSVLGQAAVHTALLISFYFGALRLMPEDQKQKPDADFVPNLVNTVCFVVNFIIQLSTFACNYQGAPFNTPIKQTKGFFNMLKYSYIFCLVIIYDVMGIGTAFSLVPIPEPLRSGIVVLSCIDFAVCLSWERMLRYSFPAKIPPQKGYMAFQSEIAQSQSSVQKKQQ